MHTANWWRALARQNDVVAAITAETALHFQILKLCTEQEIRINAGKKQLNLEQLSLQRICPYAVAPPD